MWIVHKQKRSRRGRLLFYTNDSCNDHIDYKALSPAAMLFKYNSM